MAWSDLLQLLELKNEGRIEQVSTEIRKIEIRPTVVSWVLCNETYQRLIAPFL